MKAKILILLVSIALLVGVLSGCTTPVTETNKPPEAKFSYDPSTGIHVGTEIQFTDESNDKDGTVESWSWNFDDGKTSDEKNPTHAYDSVGKYTVTLIVTDNDGDTSEPYRMDIEVTYVPPQADFTYEPMVNITVDTPVTFMDNSTKGDANITEWYWEFGDGNSTEQNPEHKFTAEGTYTVTLTVKDENGLMDTKSVLVEVTEAEETG